ncbi:methyl-accepting chemotaxis protein [Sedimentibacter acidaminivorans]|uniref:Methyl-accepting chemotaxis protein n=1 Tax=Sedimentibacter acidaminivorans TaxID=913099 RepID=A0ABS4GE63_9FIRM|nr:methyl-accepting chemotaxis protein [Sedimentibacter acidaminivorans]MBP1925983.1 methyl-accepting chemotaxis protein [Sedimentibacter acidaminivorans]
MGFIKLDKIVKKDMKVSKSKRTTTIRSKLVSAIFLACLVLLTISGVVISTNVRTEYESTKQELLLEKALRVSGEANEFFDRYTVVAEMVSNNKTVQNYLMSTQNGTSVTTNENFLNVINILKDAQKGYDGVVSSVYVAEESPSSYVTSSKTVVKENVDLTQKAYYRTLKDGLMHVSEIYKDSNTGSMAVTISVPIKVNGQVIGEVCADILIDKLEQMTGDNKFGESGYFTLLTGDNNIAYSKDADKLLKNITEVGFDEKLVSAIKENNTDLIEYEENGEKHVGSLGVIGDTGWKLVSSMSEDEFSQATEDLSNKIIFIFLIVGMLLLVLIFILITKMTKHIVQIQRVSDKLANGDLDVEINVSSNDEVGKLADSISSLTDRLKKYIDYIDESSEVLNQFADGDLTLNLKYEYTGEFEKLKNALVNVSEMQKQVIGEIKDSSEAINSGAEQIASGASATSQGATEQASSIEELSAGINVLADAIKNTANEAKGAGNKSLEASNKVENGNEKMQELLIAINEISKTSGQIGKIIKVIDDIAFQTNILALNAAVEAARAGSAGKGFAVVADEVRNLAGKSAEAAKETTDLIENSLSAISTGTTLAGETGKHLEEVVVATEDASRLIENIVEMANDGAVAIEQIKIGVEQVSSVVQENAASAEQSAANSEELAAQVERLNELIRKFKLS